MAEASAGPRAIVAIENPGDVSVILSSELGGRLLLTLEPLPWLTLHSWPFTNHIQAAVALGNTDSPPCGVDIAILCNNRGLTCWV